MDGWSYLCATKGDLEADIIQGFLREQGILTVKRYPEFAQVMKIYSGSGAVDIYVRSSDLEAAAQLVNGTDADLYSSTLQTTKPAEEEYSLTAGLTKNAASGAKTRRIWTVIIVVCVGLILFLTLLFKQDFFLTK